MDSDNPWWEDRFNKALREPSLGLETDTTTVLHEIGPDTGNWPTRHADDIGGARRLSGVQDFAPVTLALDARRPDIDVLYTAEALTVAGHDGANRISGGSGDATLTGGGADDTAVMAGAYAADRIVFGAEIAVAEGGATDRLTGVERIRFDDGLLALDLPGSELGFVLRL